MYDNERKYNIKEITRDDILCEIKINTKIQLKQHQYALINKCIKLENEGIQIDDDVQLQQKYNVVKSNIGIIADKVGSGKSYTLLGLLLANDRPRVTIKKMLTFGCNNIIVDMNEKIYKRYLNLNVLVVPHNILRQWQTYIINLSDEFRLYVANTTKTVDLLHTKLNDINLLLVTSTFFRKVATTIVNEDIHVNRVIFDEVDSANTPNAKHIPSYFYWFISASYKNIINPYARWHYDRRSWESSYMISSGISNNTFVKNIFANLLRSSNYLETNVIDGIIMKNDDKFVDSSFSLPDIIKQIIVCKSSNEISILKDVINHNILSCLNAGDLKGAVSHINQENIDTEDNIIYYVKRDFDIKLSNTLVNLEYSNNIIYPNQSIKEKAILKIQKEKEDLENKIKLLTERIRNSDTCTICYNQSDNKCITNCCKNTFCLMCITKWCVNKSTCPLCKIELDVKKHLFLVDDNKILKANSSININIFNERDTKDFNKFENFCIRSSVPL